MLTGLVIATLVLGALVWLAARPPRTSANPHPAANAASAWVRAHHWTVVFLAASGALALALPGDLLGSTVQTQFWGGHLATYGVWAAFSTVALVPLSVGARLALRARHALIVIGAVSIAWAGVVSLVVSAAASTV